MAVMELEETISQYLLHSNSLTNDSEAFVSDTYGMIEAFTKSKLKKAKLKLADYYKTFITLDKYYSVNLSSRGAFNDVVKSNSMLANAERARNVFVSNLNRYEQEILSIEANSNFKVTTSIAGAALAVSIMAMAF